MVSYQLHSLREEDFHCDLKKNERNHLFLVALLFDMRRDIGRIGRYHLHSRAGVSVYTYRHFI